MDNLDSPSARCYGDCIAKGEGLQSRAILRIHDAQVPGTCGLRSTMNRLQSSTDSVQSAYCNSALLLQDLVEPDARARGRLGAIGSLSWPAIAVLGIDCFSTEGSVMVGHLLMFVVSAGCFFMSREYLRGSLDAQRFRGIMTLGGLTIGGAILLSSNPESNPLIVGALILSVSGLLVVQDLFGGDLDRAERKRFGRTLDALEVRILNLQAQGVSLDQASSLCRNASDVGYKDPELGFSILAQAGKTSSELWHWPMISQKFAGLCRYCRAGIGNRTHRKTI